jgi:hypothetical protein
VKYIIFLTLVILSSCSDVEFQDKKQLSPIDRIEKFDYSGHSYVVWSGYHRGGIIHDPDCHCQKQK